jgi:MFS family permease
MHPPHPTNLSRKTTLTNRRRPRTARKSLDKTTEGGNRPEHPRNRPKWRLGRLRRTLPPIWRLGRLRRTLPPKWRLRRLRRTLPPALNLSDQASAARKAKGTGRLIVLRSTPKEKLTEAIAYITWPGLTALVAGPPLGGFITTYASWHRIFFLNLPIGIIALLLTLLWVENVRSGESHGFDWLTFLLAGFASAGAVYGMEKLGSEGVSWQLPGLVLALSILSGVAAVVAAHRNPETSLIDLESMKLKTYSLSVYGASAFRIAVSVLPFLLPLMFQIAFGLNAFQSGLYLLALFAGDLTMKAFVIQALRRFGFRRLLIVNGIITAGSMALCALLSPDTAILLIILILFFHGASRSMQFTCMTTLAYTEIPHSRMSRANGFLSAVMQLSMGMGVAIGAITLRLVAHARGHSAAAPQLRDFHLAMLFMAVVALGPVFDSLGLPPDAGAATSGHRLDAVPAAIGVAE